MPHHLWIGRECDVWDAWIRIYLCFVVASWYPKSLFSAVDLVSDISAEKSGKNSTKLFGHPSPTRAIIQRVFLSIR